MRKQLFLIFLFVTLMARAQNHLRIVNTDGNTFLLYVEDSLMNTSAQNELLVKNIKKDTVNVKAVIENDKASITQTIYLLSRGKKTNDHEFTYLLSNKTGKLRFTFSSEKEYQTPPEPIVPPKPIIDTSKKYDNNILGHFAEIKNSKVTWFNNFPNDGKCQLPMSQAYINYFKQLMLRTHTDDDRYVTVDQTAQNNCISVNQLNLFLSYIPFEIEKLKLVRSSFFHLTDPENKQQLDTSFKMESSKKVLQDFFVHAEEYRFKTGITCEKASAENEIEELVQKLILLSSDTEKLILFKKTYTSYCFTTKQLIRILTVFVHDREKLEVSKLSYHHCVDKENFKYITDSFSYKSSQAEMIQFISKQN
ncbi:MAG TPA: DUF4476 domain-containing protein [Bacteroidia bacterium]|nr:DUF4476 domain-containing protein [Bacteroidia bacterium]